MSVDRELAKLLEELGRTFGLEWLNQNRDALSLAFWKGAQVQLKEFSKKLEKI